MNKKIKYKKNIKSRQPLIIDLSLPIEDDIDNTFPTYIERLNHADGADYLGWVVAKSKGRPFFERVKNIIKYYLGTRRITRSDMPDNMFISHETVTASVHMGTHIDAPYHFGPVCEGKEAKDIEDIPLEWCFSNGVVLDMSHKKNGDAITIKDIESSLKKIRYKIKPMDIVLLKTGADKYNGTKKYLTDFPGVSREATEWLVNKGVKIVGVDFLGFDRPYPYMIGDYFRTKDNSHLWPSHLFGRKKEYCHIERLANLDKIPKPYGFKVACFPVKIKNVGASWARVVAIV